MKVKYTSAVDIALRTLGQEDRQRVQAWFDHLKNWDKNPFVRVHSYRLEENDNVYVFKTSSEFWIFFRLEKETITVIDVAKKDSVAASAQSKE